jgi:heparinase II/III-like protein
MIPKPLARLARMDAAEIRWRGVAATRSLVDRARSRMIAPRWRRDALLPVLAPLDEFTAVRSALSARRWDRAHIELGRHFAETARRFPLSCQSKPTLVARIIRSFPDAASDATASADRILAGEYDLLGYRRLRFMSRESSPSTLPDWQYDPVHECGTPRMFWATVPYLEPRCGDHKIIWELNRHQQWLKLGRAYWLTGRQAYRDRFIAELVSWLDANPPLIGVNWASMLELGFRTLSWMWALHLFVETDLPDELPWLVDLLAALDRQATHIERNLSHYFSPNTHLLGEALALYVAGRALPELAASARRVSLGRRILLDEIERQIASDGGHSERSTHYHRYALDFYSLALIVACNTGDEAAPRFEEAVRRLGRAARLLADRAGRTPHLGDDDGGMLTPITGRAPDDLRDSLAIAAALVDQPELSIGDLPEEALWMLGPGAALNTPGDASDFVPSSALPETGYYVSRTPAGDHLVLDGGPHGYRNGGHAHADALSLTFAVRGKPLLIDPGTGCYTADAAIRDRMRSSALHNTLTLDDRSQSVPDGPFHWSHVARTQVLTWHTDRQFDYFDARHDGYRPVEHRRRVLSLHGDLIVVADFVGGTGTHTAAVHWHLDPRWIAEIDARHAVLVRPDDDGIRVAVWTPQGQITASKGDALTGLGWWSPAYGRLDPTTTLRVIRAGAVPFWIISVFDLDPHNAVTAVDFVPISFCGAGPVDHHAAVRITRTASVDHIVVVEPSVAAAPIRGAVGTDRDLKQPSVSSPLTRVAWRTDEVETDARMVYFRSIRAGTVGCVAAVDATYFRPDTTRAGSDNEDRTCAGSRVS